MKDASWWFEQYGVSHKNPTNILIHKICVPLITWSLLALIWIIPVPEAFKAIGVNWGTIFIIGALAFYLRLNNLKLILAVILLASPVIIFLYQFSKTMKTTILAVSTGVFVIAWIGQFIGHKIEGKKPSFAEDLLFLLIGPAWCIDQIFPLVKKETDEKNN